MTLPSTAWKETIAEGEAARFERYAQDLHALQLRNVRNGVTRRALHAKGVTGVMAEFTVLPSVPEYARVGVFATPGTYPTYVRFSNGSGLVQPDRTPDIRGIALKLVGVGGRKILPGLEDARTQDFLLIRSASTPFRNADDFVAFVLAAESPVVAVPGLVWRFGFGGISRILGKLAKTLKEPVPPLAKTRFHSALPIRLGAHAVRYALSPSGPPGNGDRPRDLGAEMAQRLRGEPVAYDFQVQFFRDEIRTPIEDSSVEWLPENAPFVTLARLVLPRQDPDSPRGRRIAEFIETLSFDPWHAPDELRPLGNMMRARREAYRLSSIGRGAAPEPDGSERFDATGPSAAPEPGAVAPDAAPGAAEPGS